MASDDNYQAVDAVVSSNFSIYSPSVSRVRDDVNPGAGSSSRTGNAAASSNTHEDASERDHLLGPAGKAVGKKPFYRPRPLW